MKDGSAPYLIGPIARYNNNQSQLSDRDRQMARKAGLDAPTDTIRRSNRIPRRLLQDKFASKAAACM